MTAYVSWLAFNSDEPPDVRVSWVEFTTLEVVGTDTPIQWNATQRVEGSTTVVWNTLATAQVEMLPQWASLSGLGFSQTLSWDALQAVAQEAVVQWALSTGVGSSVTVEWDSAQLVGNNLLTRWRVGDLIVRDFQYVDVLVIPEDQRVLVVAADRKSWQIPTTNTVLTVH